jgi:hypothetical protein
MDFWIAELDTARQEVSVIEARIALEREKARQRAAEKADASREASLINVLKGSLARTQAYVRYIEHRMQGHTEDVAKRQCRSALRAGAGKSTEQADAAAATSAVQRHQNRPRRLLAR